MNYRMTKADLEKYNKFTYQDHGEAITKEITGYYRIYANRDEHAEVLAKIEAKIRSLFSWKFGNYPTEAEFIEAIIRQVEARRVMELGMYQGFTTLHMIRAVYPEGQVVSIDCSPAHDQEFFLHPDIARCFRFIKGDTVEVINSLPVEELYDVIFIDSAHTPDATEKELHALLRITHPGSLFLFHDIPRIQAPDQIEDCPMRKFFNCLLGDPRFQGMIFPSCWRIDCAIGFGAIDYHPDLNPHMGVLRRIT